MNQECKNIVLAVEGVHAVLIFFHIDVNLTAREHSDDIIFRAVKVHADFFRNHPVG